MNLQKTIKRILKEEIEISKFLRRRIDFNNLDNIVDETKVDNFREDLRITYSIKNTILAVLYKIMPEEDSITHDSEVYYEVWDGLKLYLMDRYYDELYKYFERRKQELFTEGELTEKCWKGYTQKGMKTMFGKRYPNCVKIKKK